MQLKKILSLSFALVFLAAGVVLVSTGQVGAQSSRLTSTAVTASASIPVNIVNTPLPVQGTVTANVPGGVAVTGNVNANITNSELPVTGSVAVTSLPTATVANASSNPLFVRDVDNLANEPFNATLCYGSGLTLPCYFGQTQPGNFFVPTTTSDGKSVKQLIIQFVDGGCDVAQGGELTDLDLSTVVYQNPVNSNIGIYHIIPFSSNPSLTSPTEDHLFYWATPVQLIANANTPVYFVANTRIGTSFACSMNLSGYLVTQ